MKVSIITCTSNSASILAWNLKSISIQTHIDIEHIIIDNNSSDNTIEIAKEFPHITKIISEPDNGIYFAMNKGIAHATGDIIGFLNSDDYLSGPDVISKIVERFKKTNCSAVYGSLIYVKEHSLNEIHRVWQVEDYNHRLPFKGWMLPHPTFYVKKEVYQNFGVFNTEFKFAADYEIILRFLLKHQISVSPISDVLVYMRTGGATNKNLFSRFQVHLEDWRAWKSIGLAPKWYTLFLKPLRKTIQFIIPYFSIKWRLHELPEYHPKIKNVNTLTNINKKIIVTSN